MKMSDLRISEHFWVKEFVCHGVVCACHGALLYDEKLILLLEKIRSQICSDQPIIVNCGFRCDVHNTQVGGFKGSNHTYGLAADITSETLRKALQLNAAAIGDLEEDLLGRGQGNVIYYPARRFIHVDVGPTNWQTRVREKA